VLSVGSVKVRQLLIAAFAVALLTAAPLAHATIVERVVAVIGERPVLWTELLHRALSGRVQIRAQTRDPNVISVQEQEMYKELLSRMIDDRLEELVPGPGGGCQAGHPVQEAKLLELLLGRVLGRRCGLGHAVHGTGGPATGCAQQKTRTEDVRISCLWP